MQKEVFFETAKFLTQNSRCTLIGSLCLYINAPQLLDREVHDVDLFADFNEQNLRLIISLLESLDFEVYSWQDRIDSSVPMSLLKGRYYIRGIRDGFHVDVTYEEDGISYSEMQRYEYIKDGIRLYNCDGLIRLLSVSDRDDHISQMNKLVQYTSEKASGCGELDIT